MAIHNEVQDHNRMLGGMVRNQFYGGIFSMANHENSEKGRRTINILRYNECDSINNNSLFLPSKKFYVVAYCLPRCAEQRL